MITDTEIKKLRSQIEQALSATTEQQWSTWKNTVLTASARVDGFPPRLRDKLERFIDDSRLDFYFGYREKLTESLKSQLSGLHISSNPIAFDRAKVGITFDEHKDRMWMEAYIANGRVARRAAESLGVAKSTFHDWLMRHQEGINAEMDKVVG